jgi:hypothetical protein
MTSVRLMLCIVVVAYLAVLDLMYELVRAESLPAWRTSPFVWLLTVVLVLGGLSAWHILNGSRVLGFLRDEDPQAPLRWSWTSAAFCLLFPVFVLIVLHTWLVASHSGVPVGSLRGAMAATQNHYGAVIDAGSSGSRIAIFEWRIASNGDPHVWPVTLIAENELDDPKALEERRDPKGCPVTGLSTEKERVCNCLRALARRARERTVRFLGEPNLPPIELWVKATAGVRYEGSKQKRDAVLKETDRCLGDPANYGAPSDFRWKDASVISGEEEGMYAWLAVNHVARTLRGDISATLGIVEVGGKSAQLAFPVPDPTVLTFARGKALAVPLRSGTLHVYALSQELGQNAAREGIGKAIVDKECALGGDTASCISKIRHFLCSSTPNQACGDLKPDLAPPRKMRFVGLSNFAFATRNLGLANLDLETVRYRAKQVCDASYGRNLRDAYLNPGGEKLDGARLTRFGRELGDEFVRPAGPFKGGACFSALYVTQVADFAWGVPLGNISLSKPEWASDPSWPLGAMIIEALKSQESGS